ncbi:right-handed parallel beta-helix repeat-containing protein [Ferrimonas balearica]|uniref:right-handed parallel beta-helix repeat-containing protein n=1 Tax=Ferrimonas balearica TaxID=44012 RepID=UPI001C98F6ED|nr:right-handed parallel beta-helix repeat-containing protein [Ferrimonas balearica]MBY5990780.1 right-handed parallel beta-helix repeat-containing protein [Ferrimonas balearica]
MNIRESTLILVSIAALAGCDQRDAPPNKAQVLLVPEDYRTIQQAVDAARSGDEIHIGPGIYSDRVTISDKEDLTITGSSAESVIISTGDDYAFSIYNSEAIRLSSMSITNADDGITSDAELFINNVLVYHTVDGIDMEGGSLTVTESHFFDNYDDAIDLDESTSALIEHNFISRSIDDGIEIRLHPTSENDDLIIEIRNNVIYENSGDGIQIIDYEVNTNRQILVRRNLILSNGYNGLSTKDFENSIPDLNHGSIEEYLNISNNTFALNQIGNNVSGGRFGSFNNVYYRNHVTDFQSENPERFMNSIIYNQFIQDNNSFREDGRFLLNSCFQGTINTQQIFEMGLRNVVISDISYQALQLEKYPLDLGHIDITGREKCHVYPFE